MIKAILFDMDGVLVDSIESWFRLFNKALKHFGRDEFTWKKFLERVWGGPIERDALEFFGKPVDEIAQFYFDNFDEFKKNLKLLPDAKEVLEKLRKRFKLGLVTNTPKEQACKLLDYLNLTSYFDVVVGGDETEHGKPAPDMLFLAFKKLNVDASDSVYVGDSNSDLIATKKANCLSVGVKINGDERIESLKEIFGIKKIFK